MRVMLAVAMAAALACAFAFAACGLEEGGVVAGPDGGTDDAQGLDIVVGSQDVVGPDTSLPPACGDAATCLPAFPADWQIVALLADPNGTCPAAFASNDELKDITMGDCRCSCSDMGTPGCADTDFRYTTNKSCGGGSVETGVPMDGGCFGGAGNGNNLYFRVPIVDMAGVTCASSRIGAGGASGVPVRLCEPTCQADFCGETKASGGATACIVYDKGDQPCPAGFNQKTVIATTTNPVCNDCGKCAPPMGSSCTGTIGFYGKNDCSDNGGAVYTLPADGTCNKESGNSTWTAVIGNATPPPGPFCSNAPSDPGGDAGPVGVKTVCCP